ncbi:MAG: MobC family plasmid mobilization relaxosome protein [Methylophaga sp.]|uniref:MobC family plasmid mobilization relaxosome protein n=1 Tax=Methylophaga sp. TaxID=2024840 RepID=UPI00299EBBFF|nr:MobC family plasmid mobilization relaxosome protein [Methylophaga sp.]MDX1749068.1 MobC family plasmid mobilization relaxosome protein [Methylophaga sp.]
MTVNKNKKATKDKQLKIRLTEDEFAKLKKAADADGVTMANFARRQLALDVVNRSPTGSMAYRKFTPVDPDLLRQISRLGNNLNQIARRVNQDDFDTSLELLQALLTIERRLKQVQDAHQIS